MELERTISIKGQIVIPKDARKKAGIKPGTKVTFEVEDDKIIIKRKLTAKEIVEDFADVPKKIKGLDIAKIKKLLDDEYEVP